MFSYRCNRMLVPISFVLKKCDMYQKITFMAGGLLFEAQNFTQGFIKFIRWFCCGRFVLGIFLKINQ